MEYSGAGKKLIHEKNRKQKISCHCPFQLSHKLLWLSAVSHVLDSRNLLQFLQSDTVHCKGKKEENLIENHTLFPMF